MKKPGIYGQAFIDSLAAWIYICGVAWFLSNTGKTFGPTKSFLLPAAFLSVFVLSATVVPLLVLGIPASLYLKGQKLPAVKMLTATLGFLALLTLLSFVLIPFTA